MCYVQNEPEVNERYFSSVEHWIWRKLAGIDTKNIKIYYSFTYSVNNTDEKQEN